MSCYSLVLADVVYVILCIFFFQAEDGIRDLVRSRGLGDVYKRQLYIDEESDCLSGADIIDSEAPSIYPNPVIDRLNIESTGLDIKQVEAFDNKGKLIGIYKKIQNGVSTVEWKPGVYFLKINSGQDMLIFKILKL